MSWQNDIENKIFTIITGDGRSYTPKWRNAVKLVDYNVSVFDFVNVTGSYIDRRKPKARKFDLEFYFDGENAVTIGNNFEISARNANKWTVKHPFYGEIKCQPLSLSQDNTTLNCSAFKVPVLETLLQGWPKYDIVVTDQLTTLQTTLNNYQVVDLKNTGINKVALTSLVNKSDTTISKSITDDNELIAFKKLVSNAIIGIDEVLFDTVTVLRSIQAVINYPAVISRTIKDRVNVLIEVLNNIFDSFNGSTVVGKKHVENFGGTTIAAMHIAASTNISDDYSRRSDVSNIQDILLTSYNSYLVFLDSMQTDRADSDNSYQANFDNLNSLESLVNISVANLYDLAFSAKQERSFIVDKDSNPIVLTHRFYGLDSDDVNLTNFITENNIGINELINIRKGRKVVYYV
jgi:hypothetical protein